MTGRRLRVGIVGCGLIGRKRALALGSDELVGCFDVVPDAAFRLATENSCLAFSTLDDLLSSELDVVVVAAVHSELAGLAEAALASGAHVLVEKPAGRSSEDVDRIRRASVDAKRMVKVGFNHRFHPGINRAIQEALSGCYGKVMFARGRYGHGGRIGYEKEWRADPRLSGGGEIVDQGMHLLDLSYWLFGPLPVGASLIRTHFWNAPVDDNAVLVLGERGGVGVNSPWSLFHVSWTEWKNTFSLEIYCERAKMAIDGLVGSYGSQRLAIHRMRPELGPPDTETVLYAESDASWEFEWMHFREAVLAGDGRPLWGDLSSAHYAWSCIEAAQ